MFDFEKPKIEIAEISEDKKYGKRSVGKPRYHFEALGVAESIV